MKPYTLYTLTLCLLFSENIQAQKIIKPATPSVSTSNKQVEKDSSPKIRKAPTGELAYEELDMVFVKGGTFSMGDVFEKDRKLQNPPIHAETVGDFYMGKYEVSQWLWSVIMDKNPARNYRFQCPVENVNWRDIQVFIKKLNEKTGRKFRLPTEVEWEYAAREGGKMVRYGNGKNKAKIHKMNFYEPNLMPPPKGGVNMTPVSYSSHNPDVVTTSMPLENKILDTRTTQPYTKDAYSVPQHYTRNYASTTKVIKLQGNNASVPIKSFSPNNLGLYNMAGNIDELCTAYDDTLRLVVRGGNWFSEPDKCTTFFRDYTNPYLKNAFMGFRLVEDVD